MLLGHGLPGIRVRGSREVDDKSRLGGPRVGVGDGDATPNKGSGVGVAEREEVDEKGKNEKVELADDVMVAVGGER